MLFTETETPGIYLDEKGERWPLGAGLVTQLRNSGNTVVPREASGGGNGSLPGVSQADVADLGSFVRQQQDANDIRSSVQSKLGVGTHQAPAPSNLPPLGQPAQQPRMGDEWRNFQNDPRSMPAEGNAVSATNLARVLPRERTQQAPTQQRFYKQVASTPGGWVDTARQTSGWSQEQQDDMRQRALDSDKLRQDALNQQYEATYRQAEADKFRAEADKGEAFNKMREEQQKLDTQNLYMEDKQKKIGAQLKAARERQVDPTKPFQGVGGGIAGVLAVLGSSLGQYSAGINGGPNNALQLFNNMIERSVNEQLRLIEEEKDGALMSKADLDDFQFRNTEEKKALIRARELEGKQAELDSVLTDKALVAVHPMAAQMRADLADRLNQELSTLNSAISRTAGERYQPPQAGGRIDVTEQVLAGQAKESGYRKTIRENDEAASGAIGETSIVSPDGNVIGNAPNAARAEKLNERGAAFNEAERLATEMLDISNRQADSGSLFRSEEDKALYNSLATRYKNALWSAIRSDAPSAEESAQFEAAMGGADLANFRGGRQRSVLQQTLEDGRNNLADRIKQQGGDPSYLRKRKPNAKNEGYTP